MTQRSPPSSASNKLGVEETIRPQVTITMARFLALLIAAFAMATTSALAPLTPRQVTNKQV